ncbi:MAG: baseplate J/gp47 family protein [Pseudomonadota bacterium]|nr:baseplate J/gp47 family protein [Pseudomonadota bacterium]
MLVPGQNQLAKPEIVKVEAFETLLASFKRLAIDYVAQSDADMATALEEAFANEANLSTKLVEALVVALQSHTRKYNERIEQQFAWWATGSNLDAKLAEFGLERQVVDEGDPDAYPPIPATLEEDAHARLRYYLAPHAPAAGSRMHYRHELLTLDDRANVTVETGEAGKVIVTYTLDPNGYAAQIKDGNGRIIEPNTGRVAVNVLARAGDGTPSNELLAAVRDHFDRPDTAPETDDITVRAAEIIRYQIRAVVWINAGPDAQITQETAVEALQGYADEQHVLAGEIDPSWIDYYLHASGAKRIEIESPAAAIIAGDHQAPYCTGITVEVRTL